jgi:hypothetical protein
MIPAPCLLYLGETTDELSAKTSRGVAVWRPEPCVGEHRGAGCTITLGLPHLDFAAAAAAGARTLIIGVANAGGVMGEATVRDAAAAWRSPSRATTRRPAASRSGAAGCTRRSREPGASV